MRSNAGVIAVTVIAMFLGVLAVTQIQAQDVYSRSLQLETPSSLTTLIANLSERNNAIKEEILDLRRRTETARDAIASGKGSLTEAERQLSQLRVFAGVGAVSGAGVTVRIDGTFDERALSDLVNELRNAGAEAIAVNTARVGPRSWFGTTADRALTVDALAMRGPWQVRAVGSPEVMYVAMTRTGGIIGQFELIYKGTRFDVSKESAIDLPALATPLR
ncbi:MAG TPA: DUF881 domain-containing protein [Candidatus Limnocylindria bacterium]|jgi:uncharacterized protein YlxW (UPF0749 family)|nr:DUF881 domain-containing protein [Candidatus Limnocylindria bacterium]